MTSQPTVSVITPAFNRADYLPFTIESVLAQTYPEFEHIIVDDGSSDGTARVVQEYSDPRIRYLHQTNQGQSVARNRGIEASRGQYICFLDSDDVWFSNKLRDQLEVFAEEPDAGVVYGDRIAIDGQGRELHRRNMRRHSGWVTAPLLADNFVSMNTTMARTAVIKQVGGFNPDDGQAEDYGLWLRASVVAPFRYVPTFWAYYRIMEDQLSSDKIGRLEDNERLLRDFVSTAAHGLKRYQTRYGLSRFYERKGRHEVIAGRRLGGMSSACRALAYDPIRLRTWRTLARITWDVARRRPSGEKC